MSYPPYVPSFTSERDIGAYQAVQGVIDDYDAPANMLGSIEHFYESSRDLY